MSYIGECTCIFITFIYYLIAYITIRYSESSTTSISFWLSWFLDIVLKANMIKGHRFESNALLILNGLFSARFKKRL